MKMSISDRVMRMVQTHIVRVESFSICRILHQQAFKSKDLGYELFRHIGERAKLELVQFVFFDNVFENGVKLVQDLDPGVKI